ncbi:AC transposase [Ceratobasidium sp. AG-Ba]|nr:AC transposase [Ceratobasidium sp. AG-Ba]
MSSLPTPVPPPKRRRRRANANRSRTVDMPDSDVWARSDQEILDATLPTWVSPVYAHYNVALVRHTRSVFKFTCKTNPLHPPVYRRCEDTKRGTGNLHSSMATCLKHAPPTESTSSTSSTSAISSSYSYWLHLAILVMSCAYHYIPFARFIDDLFRQQVEMLRPGTATPDSTTISRATHYVYAEQARHVKSYFEDIDTVHLAIDGWTSPTATAYLGFIVHWYSEGRLWSAVLEFIRLEQKHTGAYIATKTYECLQRYVLDKKFLAVCLDNAGNNNTLVRHLAGLAPDFRGTLSRVCCAPHVINLMVKAFMEHFKKPTARKRKAVKYKKSNKPRRTELPVSRREASEADLDEQIEYVLEEGNAPDDVSKTEESPPVQNDDTLDSDKELHDQYVIKETTTEALQYARRSLELSITESMQKLARGVLSKAANLARKLHDTASLQSKFEDLIDALASQIIAVSKIVGGALNF